MNAFVLVLEVMASHAARVDKERFIICICGVYYYILRDISLLIDVLWWFKLLTKHYKESESAADDTVCAWWPNAWRAGISAEKGGSRERGAREEGSSPFHLL